MKVASDSSWGLQSESQYFFKSVVSLLFSLAVQLLQFSAPLSDNLHAITIRQCSFDFLTDDTVQWSRPVDCVSRLEPIDAPRQAEAERLKQQ